MRIIHCNLCQFGSSLHYFRASHSLAPSKAVPTQLTISPIVPAANDAGMDIGGPNGKIIGATGIGAIAFRRRGGIYLAKTWRTSVFAT